MGAPIDKRVDALLSIAAGILFVASGAVIIDQWSVSCETSDKNVFLASGSICIICGFIFMSDTVVIYRSQSLTKY